MEFLLLIIFLAGVFISKRKDKISDSSYGPAWKIPTKPGQWTEDLTERAISHLGGYCKCLRNVYLPNNGITTELDVLLIHEKGIFVFESKDYSGWIFGSAEQRQWTQCFKNGEKYHFYNPVKQNATHCKALSNFLGIPLELISSYIVFSEHGILKQIPEDTYTQKIAYLTDLPHKMKCDLEIRSTVFTCEQVDALYARLYPQTEVTEMQRVQHVENVRKFAEGTVCPFCGGQLVLRSGRYGEFYGCSNYPECRFTRKISQ